MNMSMLIIMGIVVLVMAVSAVVVLFLGRALKRHNISQTAKRAFQQEIQRAKTLDGLLNEAVISSPDNRLKMLTELEFIDCEGRLLLYQPEERLVLMTLAKLTGVYLKDRWTILKMAGINFQPEAYEVAEQVIRQFQTPEKAIIFCDNVAAKSVFAGKILTDAVKNIIAGKANQKLNTLGTTQEEIVPPRRDNITVLSEWRKAAP